MLETLLGGFLAVIGGWGATWYQAKSVRRIKMEERIAEKKIEANAEAYAYTKEIQSALRQASVNVAKGLFETRESWFFGNRLFLPGQFPDHWLKMRHAVQKAAREGSGHQDHFDWTNEAERVSEQAIQEVYRDMDLRPMDAR